jgi:cytochrome c peroxidase
VAAGDVSGQQILSPQETRGLRVFLTRGNCVTCHNGPLLTDHDFHNTGVRSSGPPDRGRYEGIRRLLRDEFNCLGPYSDAKPEQCTELQFLTADDKSQIGSFRTPGLRNVALRAPYMHAGQLGTLEEVVRHYMRRKGVKSWGSKGRIAIHLEESDVPDLVAFLGTLTGPVSQDGQ